MTRRQMFKAISGVGVAAMAALLPKRLTASAHGRWIDFGAGAPVRLHGNERIMPAPYGYLSVEECKRRGLDPKKATVFLDGKDVTSRTLVLHDDEGWIEVYSEQPDGKGGKYKFANVDGNLARHKEYGRVEVRFSA